MTRTHLHMGGRRGQSLVEFALVVPILLLMLVGIIEFGRAWNVSQTVTYAARQGSRVAAVLNATGSDPVVARDSVVAVVTNVLASNNINTTGCPPGCVDSINGLIGGQGTPVTVWVGVPYQFMIMGPVMALNSESFPNGTITLRSTAVMRNE